MYHTILHFLPAPAKAALGFLLGFALLVMGLVLLATRLPAAMGGDLHALGNLVVIGVPMALVSGFCLLIASAIFSPESPMGFAGATVAVAGAVTTVIFLTVPLAKLQIGAGGFPEDPTLLTPVLMGVFGPGTVIVGGVVVAVQWRINRRKAQRLQGDAEA
jgi:hypothetical protein